MKMRENSIIVYFLIYALSLHAHGQSNDQYLQPIQQQFQCSCHGECDDHSSSMNVLFFFATMGELYTLAPVITSFKRSSSAMTTTVFTGRLDSSAHEGSSSSISRWGVSVDVSIHGGANNVDSNSSSCIENGGDSDPMETPVPLPQPLLVAQLLTHIELAIPHCPQEPTTAATATDTQQVWVVYGSSNEAMAVGMVAQYRDIPLVRIDASYITLVDNEYDTNNNHDDSSCINNAANGCGDVLSTPPAVSIFDMVPLFPEEINQQALALSSTIHIVFSGYYRSLLIRQGVHPACIHVIGDRSKGTGPEVNNGSPHNNDNHDGGEGGTTAEEEGDRRGGTQYRDSTHPHRQYYDAVGVEIAEVITHHADTISAMRRAGRRGATHASSDSGRRGDDDGIKTTQIDAADNKQIKIDTADTGPAATTGIGGYTSHDSSSITVILTVPLTLRRSVVVRQDRHNLKRMLDDVALQSMRPQRVVILLSIEEEGSSDSINRSGDTTSVITMVTALMSSFRVLTGGAVPIEFIQWPPPVQHTADKSSAANPTSTVDLRATAIAYAQLYTAYYNTSSEYISIWGGRGDDNSRGSVSVGVDWLGGCVAQSKQYGDALIGGGVGYLIEAILPHHVQRDMYFYSSRQLIGGGDTPGEGAIDFVSGHSWTLKREHLRGFFDDISHLSFFTREVGVDMQLSFALQRHGIATRHAIYDATVFLKTYNTDTDETDDDISRSSSSSYYSPLSAGYKQQRLLCELLDAGFRTHKCNNCDDAESIAKCLVYFNRKALHESPSSFNMQQHEEEGENARSFEKLPPTHAYSGENMFVLDRSEPFAHTASRVLQFCGDQLLVDTICSQLFHRLRDITNSDVRVYGAFPLPSEIIVVTMSIVHALGHAMRKHFYIYSMDPLPWQTVQRFCYKEDLQWESCDMLLVATAQRMMEKGVAVNITRLIYMRVGKTGSSSLGAQLEANKISHVELHQIALAESFIKQVHVKLLVSVRDPFRRTISAYHYRHPIGGACWNVDGWVEPALNALEEMMYTCYPNITSFIRGLSGINIDDSEYAVACRLVAMRIFNGPIDFPSHLKNGYKFHFQHYLSNLHDFDIYVVRAELSAYDIKGLPTWIGIPVEFDRNMPKKLSNYPLHNYELNCTDEEINGFNQSMLAEEYIVYSKLLKYAVNTKGKH